MEFFLIYVYIVLSKLSFLAGILLLFGGAFTLAAWVLAGGMHSEGDSDLLRLLVHHRRPQIYTILLLLMLLCAVPDKEEVAWIIGGGVAYNIASTEEAQQLPDNVLGALNTFLEQGQEDEQDTTTD